MGGFFFPGGHVAWYDNGVEFSCRMCGHCCSGEPGSVFLSDKSIDDISSFLGMDRQEFIQKYTRQVDMGTYRQISLKERDDYSCVFLGEKGCTIYPVRPLQCMTYPFWPYLFEDRALWEAEKSNCPGIGSGEHHDANEIRRLVRQTLLEKLVTIVD